MKKYWILSLVLLLAMGTALIGCSAEPDEPTTGEGVESPVNQPNDADDVNGDDLGEDGDVDADGDSQDNDGVDTGSELEEDKKEDSTN